jgi:hypothetical protein
MTFHLRFEMASDVFGYFFHQTQVDFLDLAAFAANEVVMMPRFDVPANVISFFLIFIRGSQQNPAPGQTVQNPINRGQANTSELFLQFCLHLQRVKQTAAFQKQLDNGANFGRDAPVIFLEPVNINANGR